MFDALPPATALTANRGCDGDRFRTALECRGIEPCIPPRKGRRVQHPYDARLYHLRHHIEKVFGNLKDWRPVATRYDRCGDIFIEPSSSPRTSNSGSGE